MNYLPRGDAGTGETAVAGGETDRAPSAPSSSAAPSALRLESNDAKKDDESEEAAASRRKSAASSAPTASSSSSTTTPTRSSRNLKLTGPGVWHHLKQARNA